jgi:tetrapyrrole methylase family protein/MazG family protein
MKITIVGLGPGDPALLTLQAWDLLSQAGEIYLRTRRHPTVAGLPQGVVLHSLDDLYDRAADFSAVYEAIADQILALGRRPGGVVYAVPGHPLVGEASVQHILRGAAAEGLPVRLVDGLSFIEPVLDQLGLDALAGLQLADATDLAAAHHPALDPDRPALIGQLYSRRLASEVKLTLMNAYPEEHPVTIVRAAGSGQASSVTLPLYELDRRDEVDHLTALYLPPLSACGSAGLPGLQETVARLRAPDGCPWDREQTHKSLRSTLLEEAYEVLAALDAEDDEKLAEELGDLLMQVAMHVQIATEEGAFRFADVIARIDAKLKRRHPHVFGNLQVRDSDEVLRNWEAIKAEERQASRASAEAGHETSPLGGVPPILPALARAQALGERAARAGFDWPDVEGVLAKVAEEAGELAAAGDGDAREEEFGDLLFALANLARWVKLDAEMALRRAADRFTRRYTRLTELLTARGTDLWQLSLSERKALWREARPAEKE